MMRGSIVLIGVMLAAACQSQSDSTDEVAADRADTTAVGNATTPPAADPGAGNEPDAAGPGATQARWPAAGPVDYRREHRADMTGDERSEVFIATARGPSYDSLDIAITIRGADGDTLWYETWPSLLYFNYDPLEGKADSTVMRIVTDHVEQLLAGNRFNMQGGLPAVLRRGGEFEAIMREAIHYHLAELDWRREAGLSPAQATPPDGYSEISTDQVPAARVDAVLAEMRTKPSFMYFAGGEATYAIAWSDREGAFVRIFSCC